MNRFRGQFSQPGQAASLRAQRSNLSRYYQIRFSAGTLDEAMEACQQHPLVEHVEPIGIHALSLEANDPFFRDSPVPDFQFDQWHYWDANGMGAAMAWDIETGSKQVVVGILDSGTRYFHVDLGGNNPIWGPDDPADNGNIWINPGEIAGNGFDDDGNGYEDDAIGWDFVENAGGGPVSCIDQDCTAPDNDPDDFNGHGTHVSGTVAAITNNGRSVTGVAGGFSDGTNASPANGVKIMPLRIGYQARVQGRVTGLVRMDWAAQAMTYVADQIDRNQVNVAAINWS